MLRFPFNGNAQRGHVGAGHVTGERLNYAFSSAARFALRSNIHVTAGQAAPDRQVAATIRVQATRNMFIRLVSAGSASCGVSR